jgi:hypothetical protein
MAETYEQDYRPKQDVKERSKPDRLADRKVRVRVERNAEREMPKQVLHQADVVPGIVLFKVCHPVPEDGSLRKIDTEE